MHAMRRYSADCIGPGVAALLWLLIVSAPALGEQDIFLTIGEDGELSFSDVAGPGAQRVVVEAEGPLDDPLAELDRRIEQTLSVANALEASRLAREKLRAEARAEARERAPRQQPEVVYQDRYVTSPYLYPPARPRGFRSGRDGSGPDGSGPDGSGPGEGPSQDPPPDQPAQRGRAFPAPD